MEFKHTTVLLKQAVDALNVKPNGLYIDCTAGGGGHSIEIAKKGGRLICFDVDITAVESCEDRLKRLVGADYRMINANFADMTNYINDGANGILMDLGVSSPQLDIIERGFTYHGDAPLDMRMSATSGTYSAYDVVNTYSEEELTKILYEYGEEKYAKGIVRGILAARQAAPIKTTGQLAEIIKRNVPLSVRNAKNPCKKTFQAIRIEVNDELGSLSRGLDAAFELLLPKGRLVVITFHSLEDRLVKKRFAELTAGCDCPPRLPCVCDKVPRATHITRKPIVPDENELQINRRARSAKMRVIEKS
ncbi:MAG: 16S rRNA (cytosine(1402)-N(4))-methyltransferase RsmH [Oscillospiraceae bacterium]|nr:16S rRNA (cytosine(1402)-N(4))-methyltransferase RsmH [Oscillospiraceae bacterium]